MEGDHAFAVILIDFSVDAIAGDARDMGIELLAYLVAHEFHHLILDALALCLLCNLLHVAGVFAEFLVVVAVGGASSLLIAREEAVHHRVGIAAYRRGEMGVVVEGQSVVTDIVSGVFGFHHGAEGHHLDGILLAAAVTVVHQPVERLGDGSLSSCGLHAVAELGSKLSQCLQFGGIGLVVYSIGQSLGFLPLLHFPHPFCHGAIGQQHEFLYEFVGILRLLVIAACGLARIIDIEMELLAIELHGAILEALLAQLFGQGIEDDYLTGQFPFVFFPIGSRLSGAVNDAILFQYLLHFFVGKAPVALDDGVCQMPVLDVGLFVE